MDSDEDRSSTELNYEAEGKWNKWLLTLNEDDRRRAEYIIHTLANLGDPSPVLAAYSEIVEDIPQLSRFLLLRRLWLEVIRPFRDDMSWIYQNLEQAENESATFIADAGLALRHMLGVGVPHDEIARVAYVVAYETVFKMIEVIDELYSPESNLHGWALMEIDAAGAPTGRPIAALHEDVLTSEPSG